MLYQKNGEPGLNTIDFGCGVVTWKDIKPIPLTEEWLIKFGYNEVDDFYAKGYGVNGVSIIKWENYYNAFAYQLGKGYNKIVKEVHQLQNLYSALTGKELTINENIKT